MDTNQKENDFIIQNGKLSPAALKRKTELENNPASRTDHMAYLPDMEQISSDIRDKVLAAMNAYEPDKYTARDVLAALSHDRCSIEDFKALLSPAAEPFLEKMAQRAERETRNHFGNSTYIFTPLYIANYCENYCVYCGFNCYNDIHRKQLSMEEIGPIVNLTANMELNELTLSYTFAVNVFPRNYKGDIQEAVQEYINSQDSEQKKIFLPENISGEKISYYKSASKIGKYIPIVAFIMCVAVFFLKDRDLKSEVKKRNIQLQSDYPEILSKILLYSNAGLSIKSSIERIVRHYEDEKKKNPKEYHYAYEELKMATVKMKSGVSEINAINQYGERCGLHNYIKLANIIEQNIRRGTGELSFALENELNRALVERKNTALKRGSEISTKLLGPMTVMLIVALVILMVPALMSINM